MLLPYYERQRNKRRRAELEKARGLAPMMKKKKKK